MTRRAKHRYTEKRIDPLKGTAAGYIANTSPRISTAMV